MDGNNDLDRQLGARLKALREARGWALAELATHAGVSKAMISKVERGESSPTAALLGRLSAALELTVSQLLAMAEGETGRLARADEQPRWRDPATGFARRSLTPRGAVTPLELIHGELPPGAEITYPAGSYTFIDQQVVVLDGHLRLTQDGAGVDLGAGDCLHFGPPAETRFENPGDAPCRYIVAVLRRR